MSDKEQKIHVQSRHSLSNPAQYEFEKDTLKLIVLVEECSLKINKSPFKKSYYKVYRSCNFLM